MVQATKAKEDRAAPAKARFYFLECLNLQYIHLNTFGASLACWFQKNYEVCSLYHFTQFVSFVWQAEKKKPLNRALSLMEMGETIDVVDDDNPRAPACKRPRHSKEVVESLDSPDVVGHQTVSCQKHVSDVL